MFLFSINFYLISFRGKRCSIRIIFLIYQRRLFLLTAILFLNVIIRLLVVVFMWWMIWWRVLFSWLFISNISINIIESFKRTIIRNLIIFIIFTFLAVFIFFNIIHKKIYVLIIFLFILRSFYGFLDLFVLILLMNLFFIFLNRLFLLYLLLLKFFFLFLFILQLVNGLWFWFKESYHMNDSFPFHTDLNHLADLDIVVDLKVRILLSQSADQELLSILFHENWGTFLFYENINLGGGSQGDVADGDHITKVLLHLFFAE